LSQAEDYKFKATSADVTLHVDVADATDCLVLNDQTEHEFSTGITDGSGHFDTPIAVNGPVDKLFFEARKNLIGVSNFIVQYSVDNGANWRNIANPDLGLVTWKDFGPYDFPGLEDDERVTHIRFGAEVGGTLSKYYKNIKITRKKWFKIENAEGDEISSLSMPLNTIENTAQAKFYIDYSTCDDVIKLAVDNPHFTLSTTEFDSNGDNMGYPTGITVSYFSATPGTHTGTVTIYTQHEHKTITVTGVTEKKTQTIAWQAGFEGNPVSLPVGLNTNNGYVVATASSGNLVTFTSGNPDIIRVSEDGYTFEVLSVGTTTLTAHADGNSDWKSVSDTKTVNTTDKKIQVIQWNQNLSKGLLLEDVVTLDAKVVLMNVGTGNSMYSEERTSLLTYSCPVNNGVISVSGNQMTLDGEPWTKVEE
jgi:hypothetical protein